jgi:tetratricopeptide (TPR) repeat protein
VTDLAALGIRSRGVRRAVLLAAVTAILLVLAHWLVPGDAWRSWRAPARPPTKGAPLSYDEAVGRADGLLAGAEDLARARGGEWLVQDRLANILIERARLTGSFDDYAAAQQALDRAFATAPAGSGPHMTQAALAFGLHRLAAAEAALNAIDRYAVPAEAEVRAEVAATRCDIAFYRGDYAGALRRCRGSGGSEDTGDAFRLAVYLGKTGRTDEALKSLDRAQRDMGFPTAQGLANLDLLRGALELQRGAWDRASADFARADKVFPGYWLTEAHRAQMLALAGKRAEAIARFEAIAARAKAPEVMDALAGLYRAQGDFPRSKAWSDRAGAVWQTRLRQLPEAAWGHAVEHELAFGDPARALDLAQKDYAARPYGGSAIALAWAYVANNRPADALRAVDKLAASPWVSADEHIVAAQAHALLGQSDAADAEQQKALAINPHSLDRDAALIWFGHS